MRDSWPKYYRGIDSVCGSVCVRIYWNGGNPTVPYPYDWVDESPMVPSMGSSVFTDFFEAEWSEITRDEFEAAVAHCEAVNGSRNGGNVNV